MKCKLEDIFNAQRALMERFLIIEAEGGFAIPPRIPVNLHDRHDQLRLKELAWRVTEEIGETVMEMTSRTGPSTDRVREEMSDVLHFLVELFIMAGIEVEEFPLRSSDRLDELYRSAQAEIMDRQELPYASEQLALVVWGLTDAMHELKNRPWKRTHVNTNVIEFRNKLQRVMDSFILACYLCGITAQLLSDLYFRKHEVNRQRQDSGV